MPLSPYTIALIESPLWPETYFKPIRELSSMPFDATRIMSGDMPPELRERVDRIADEFLAILDSLVDERHLQRGIARIQLPCSIVFILDRDSLFILGQFRMENRITGYYHRPDKSMTLQKVASSARWEFNFEDAFIIQLPADLLEKSTEQRHSSLQEIASKHIDAEFLRLAQLLSLIRTRPIFGQAIHPMQPGNLLLLLPRDEKARENADRIRRAVEASGLSGEESEDIRNGKAAVRDMWQRINQAAVILADLTGTDPQVMYSLGIAHTLGKDTILIHPQGSKYLVDIPRIESIVYEDSDQGRERLEEQIGETLRSITASL